MRIFAQNAPGASNNFTLVSTSIIWGRDYRTKRLSQRSEGAEDESEGAQPADDAAERLWNRD